MFESSEPPEVVPIFKLPNYEIFQLRESINAFIATALNEFYRLKYINDMLDALSPEKLLSRGFALISDESGNSIYSARNIREKDKLIIQFCDGKIIAAVDSLDNDKI